MGEGWGGGEERGSSTPASAQLLLPRCQEERQRETERERERSNKEDINTLFSIQFETLGRTDEPPLYAQSRISESRS